MKKRTIKKTHHEKEKSNFFLTAKNQLTPERLQRAHSKALKEIFSFQLAKIREMQGLSQSEVKGFTQSNVSRLEGRDDMKVSTLVGYIQSLGMELEITVKPKGHGSSIKLLKTGT